LPQLLEIYYKSIGQNSSLLINFPVDRRGLIHEKDAEQVMKLADKIKEDFAVDLAQNAKVSTSNERGKGFEAVNVIHADREKYWATEDGVIESSIVLTLTEPTLINRFMVQEYIPLGQRIKSFTLEVETENGWEQIYQGTTVGIKRILRFDDILAKQVRFTITDAKASPTISNIGIFYAPKLVTEPELIRSKSGEVTLQVPENVVQIFYTLDGSEPNENSNKYENPIAVSEPTTLKAMAFDSQSGKKSEVLVRNLDIPKAKWKVVNQDENATKVIDEDSQTFWQSEQNEVVIDLGESISINGFTYWPPQNRFMSGVISKYVFEGSMDGKSWKTLTSGEFSNIKNNPIEQVVSFASYSVRFIKLKSLSTTDNQPASFAEVGVLTK
jgi:alpha-L-fucosidase